MVPSVILPRKLSTCCQGAWRDSCGWVSGWLGGFCVNLEVIFTKWKLEKTVWTCLNRFDLQQNMFERHENRPKWPAFAALDESETTSSETRSVIQNCATQRLSGQDVLPQVLGRMLKLSLEPRSAWPLWEKQLQIVPTHRYTPSFLRNKWAMVKWLKTGWADKLLRKMSQNLSKSRDVAENLLKNSWIPRAPG